ncbi:hypothetical protein [Campylobacter sp. 19-13652]|nr:hypothetical protein [Campylobacter sp. 19-13652]BCX79537.1 hypothetical protein LBC_09990 [Campylobacter sp. 19-13652]
MDYDFDIARVYGGYKYDFKAKKSIADSYGDVELDLNRINL